MSDVIADFIDAMRAAGIDPVDPSSIVPHEGHPPKRFQVVGDKPGRKNGWYTLHVDQPASGSFGHFSSNISQVWRSKTSTNLSQAEREELARRAANERKAREQRKKDREEKAQALANELWQSAAPADPSHPYLIKKQVKPHSIRQLETTLLIPMLRDGKLVSLQRILEKPNDEGVQKLFLSGGNPIGAYSSIGPRPTDSVIICEGWATGASIFEATGIPVVVAFTSKNLAHVAKSFRSRMPDISITIAGDNDRFKPRVGNTGEMAANEAAYHSQGRVVLPVFKSDDGEPTDFNDLFVREGAEAVRRQLVAEPPAVVLDTKPAVVEDDAVLNVLFKDLSDPTNIMSKPLCTIRNLRLLLAQMRTIVRYNVISKDIEILIPGQSFSIDNAANASLAKIIDWCRMVKMPVDNIGDFITYIADENPYNPVATWIESKPWDGRSRLDEFFATVVAVDEKKNPAIQGMKETLLKRWLISAVAAVFSPVGISAHGVLVFQGRQYIGKTAWFKRLAPPHLNVIADGQILKTDDKDSLKQILSKWIVELGELDATFKRSDIAQLKAFITRDRDVIRAPYAKRESNFARRTVFFASVNDPHFLADPTGNRRYWTIECESLNYKHEVDTQQLWAEVLTLYRAGEPYVLRESEMVNLNAHNQNFESIDPIEELICKRLNWSSHPATWVELTATEILISVGINNPSARDTNKVAPIVQKFAGENFSKRHNGKARVLKVPAVF